MTTAECVMIMVAGVRRVPVTDWYASYHMCRREQNQVGFLKRACAFLCLDVRFGHLGLRGMEKPTCHKNARLPHLYEVLCTLSYLWLVGNGGMGTIISTITTILPFPPNQR